MLYSWCNPTNPKYLNYHDHEWGVPNFDDAYLYEIGKTTSPLSNQISADLKTKGMTFVGNTIIYSYLQAVGVIYSHDKTCELYRPQ